MDRRQLLKAGALAGGSVAMAGTLGALLPSSEHKPSGLLGTPMDGELIPGGRVFFVNAFDGVDPTGRTDSTAGIQDALNAVPDGGGFVYFLGKYLISASLRPKDGTILSGPGWLVSWSTTPPAQLLGPAMTSPMIERRDGSNGISVQGLMLKGNAGSPTAMGIYASSADGWVVRDTLFWGFGGPALKIDSGISLVFTHVIAYGMAYRAGWSQYTGAFDLGGTDSHLDYVEATAGTNNDGLTSSGHIAALLVRGDFNFITNCIAEYAEIGFVLTKSSVGHNLIMNTRADFNNGHGWLIDQPQNSLVQCAAVCNSRARDNLYDGFVVTQPHNTLVACRTMYHYQYPTRHRYGFVEELQDPGAVDEWAYRNYTLFLGCRNLDPPVSGEYHFSGTGHKAWVGASNRAIELPASCIRVASGVTTERPSASAVGEGAMWYDATLRKPVWSDGGNWRDAGGTVV